MNRTALIFALLMTAISIGTIATSQTLRDDPMRPTEARTQSTITQASLYAVMDQYRAAGLTH